MLSLLFCSFSSVANGKSNFCNEDAHQDFDFWLGSWQVTTNTDVIVRHNKITKINNGCSLLEEYSSPSGYEGKSLNIFDRTSQKWHQTWTDNTGLLLKLTGGVVGKSMILTGKSTTKGKQVMNRITWTPCADGSVKQHWETSVNDGVTWQTTFDGLYTKVN